ncbi:MAG: helix-turn-helix transcriptional regulator [Chlorobiaceae bacterium]|nr:helix-turn-helix transcriptional regulator [Chlorobiaceae bacterium]
MRKIIPLLDDNGVGANLRMVFEQSGLSQKEFSALVGVHENVLSNFMNASGGRKAKNLLSEMIAMGVNGTWFLTGTGPMFMKDLHERGEGDDRYAKAGRLLYEAMATLLPSQEMDVRSTVERILMSSPNCCGTGLELTDEEYARLVELRQNTARNRKFTDEHE